MNASVTERRRETSFVCIPKASCEWSQTRPTKNYLYY